MASVILAWPGPVQSQLVRKPKRPQLTGYWLASPIKVKALPEIVWVKQSWGGGERGLRRRKRARPGRLTDSAARTNVKLVIPRFVRPTEAPPLL